MVFHIMQSEMVGIVNKCLTFEIINFIEEKCIISLIAARRPSYWTLLCVRIDASKEVGWHLGAW